MEVQSARETGFELRIARYNSGLFWIFDQRVVTLVVLLWLAIRASKNTALGTAGGLVMGAVILQFMLGIIMVATQLPLALAVAHNGVAALLLLAVVNLNKVVRVEN